MGTPYTATASANTEVTITVTAVTGVTHEIEFVGFSFDSDPAAAKLLTIESPSGTVLQRYYVTNAGPGPVLMSGSCVKGASGQAVVVRLAADTGGAIGTLNAIVR